MTNSKAYAKSLMIT